VRLLFIDDEPTILRSYKRSFKQHDVVTATNGHDALRMIEDSAFDVIVCDMTMPAMTGMQLYMHVRDRAPHLIDRFVFATGGAVQATIDDFLRTITNPVLEKPFDLSLLHELVGHLAA
jgi:CheY-like chemotaxis protein